MQPKKIEPTVEGVKDGLVKVIREIQQLKVEIKALKDKLGEFIKDRDIHPRPRDLHIDYLRGESAETGPPKSQIAELLWELKDTSNLEIPTRALMAMARDLDGALRDVRAARSDIEAISNDSDLRAEFRNWRGE